MTPLRLALIGCGFIGRRHLENVAAMPGVALEALADVHEPAAAALRLDFGGRYHTTEPERVLDDPNVDAVIIATHHDSHTRLAVAAAQRRKHILIEKPMALTVEECRRIGDAAESAGVVLSVDFKFRFTPAVRKTREIIPRPVATLGQLAMERIPNDNWVRDPVRGGGLILATACHVLDMVCFLNDSEPVRVQAEGAADAAVATIRFASGAVAALLLADAGENPYAGKWLHEVFDGSRSAVLYDHFRQVRFSGAEPAHFAADDDGTRGVLEDFLRAIRTGTRPAITAADGERATRLALTILESLGDRG